MAVLPYDERLLDEPCEQERDFVAIEAVSGADLLGGLQREAPREGREPPQQDLLLGREQLVAPVERRLERLLARRRGAAARSEESEAVVEAAGQRGRSERVHTGGRELERQREPVQPVADPGDCGRRLAVERETRRNGTGALDEQAHGLVPEQRLRALLPVGIGDPERGDAKDDLARNAQRLAASREDGETRSTAEQGVHEGRRSPDQMLAVVEHEQQLERLELRAQGLDHRSAA